MKKTGIIYIATSPSGKSYIGQTIQKFNRRIQRHYRDAKIKGNAFANALRKYNDPKNWIWEIIYFDIPRIQLDNMEKWCVANYNTFNNGYNSTEGGDYQPMNYPEIRQKVFDSNIWRGKTNKAHSLRMTGKGNPMYGKVSAMKGRTHTTETKKKISDAKKGVVFSNEHRINIGKSRKGEDNPTSKLTWKKANEIRLKYSTGQFTHRGLAKEYGVSSTVIGKLLINKTWIR